MTFKHKLSVRLALMRDARPLVASTGLRACEEPVPSPVLNLIARRVAVSSTSSAGAAYLVGK